jgi:ribosomal protein L11 methyltransferase
MERKESYEWDYINDDVVSQLERQPLVTIYLEDDENSTNTINEIRGVMSDLKEAAARGDYGEGVDFGSLELLTCTADDSAWKDKWKEYFKPFRVSDRIVIKPTWEKYDARDGDLILEIDPGMAFGTGTHETTSMCIEMIEKYLKPGDSVLDAGCGSGILSIAAALLGAQKVLGVDIDKTAVEVARENIEKNGVAAVADARYGDLTRGVDFRGDLVVANLMAELICLLSPDVPAHLSDGGIFISSGILTEKEEMVTEALQKAGFKIIEINRKGEWCCIVAEAA